MAHCKFGHKSEATTLVVKGILEWLRHLHDLWMPQAARFGVVALIDLETHMGCDVPYVLSAEASPIPVARLVRERSARSAGAGAG